MNHGHIYYQEYVFQKASLRAITSLHLPSAVLFPAHRFCAFTEGLAVHHKTILADDSILVPCHSAAPTTWSVLPGMCVCEVSHGSSLSINTAGSEWWSNVD